MEIALLPKNALKIKGKNAVLMVDPQEKHEANAALVFSLPKDDINPAGSEVVISGPGEYEVGGVKITGIRSENDLAYSMSVDSVSVLLGKASTLEKQQTKLKEANILVVNCDNVTDASFLTTLVTNVVLLYGEKAKEVGKSIGGESVEHLSKYSGTIDKLPTEVVTVVLE